MTQTLSFSAALVVCAGSAFADIHYGDGTLKPRSFRNAYAFAFTVGGGGRDEQVVTNGNEDFLAYATAVSLDDGGGITYPQYAYARAFHESTLHVDAMRFSMWGQGYHNGLFGYHSFAATLDVWVHLSESTPYYFFFAERMSPDVFDNAAITREDGTLVPLGFNDDLTFATGTLGSGWYHVRMSMNEYGSGPMYGLIGVPNPASASVLALGVLGVGARRRRRPASTDAGATGAAVGSA
jgi:hypothetical protein